MVACTLEVAVLVIGLTGAGFMVCIANDVRALAPPKVARCSEAFKKTTAGCGSLSRSQGAAATKPLAHPLGPLDAILEAVVQGYAGL